MKLAEIIKTATDQLANISDSAKLDTEILLCHVLEKDRSYLFSWPEKELTDTQLQQFTSLLNKRLHGHPVAHLIQRKEFWSMNFHVSSDTLIPRPETELVVEQVLAGFSTTAPKSLLDLGTGSGAIALAIASERPSWNITATDQSSKALLIAKKNAQSHKLCNVEFKSGSWFEAVTDQRFDIIVSNPPYIAEADPHLSKGDVRFEPASALVSGADGLADIRLITRYARDHLNTAGMLIIEHGYDQKEAVASIFQENGFNSLYQATDLAGQPRTTSGIIV